MLAQKSAQLRYRMNRGKRLLLSIFHFSFVIYFRSHKELSCMIEESSLRLNNLSLPEFDYLECL